MSVLAVVGILPTCGILLSLINLSCNSVDPNKVLCESLW